MRDCKIFLLTYVSLLLTTLSGSAVGALTGIGATNGATAAQFLWCLVGVAMLIVKDVG
ncbi:hypothetical protein [Burkholderia vietnamiensis]|uniref:hypothetical protein n=1 Tax=Burkholderia vietnamiensis TaxID=60552 RepID=UPI001CB1AB6A|nr:hypothetical protein [Burkholderia vietnamiensis]CAG9228741.1 hypothetical protein BVI1335_70088 [Burkholderia vietnamiensis]